SESWHSYFILQSFHQPPVTLLMGRFINHLIEGLMDQKQAHSVFLQHEWIGGIDGLRHGELIGGIVAEVKAELAGCPFHPDADLTGLAVVGMLDNIDAQLLNSQYNPDAGL